MLVMLWPVIFRLRVIEHYYNVLVDMSLLAYNMLQFSAVTRACSCLAYALSVVVMPADFMKYANL